MLTERIQPADMESEFFCTHLVERLRWAVEDAHVAPSPAEPDGENSRPSLQRFPGHGTCGAMVATTTSAKV